MVNWSDWSDLGLAILCCLLIVIIVVILLYAIVVQHPVMGQVTDVIEAYIDINGKLPHYLVQLGEGKYYFLGESAGKNLLVGRCYLLRQGAFSNVYNLFEPIPCKEGW